MEAAAANATTLTLEGHLPRCASSACALAIAHAAPRVQHLRIGTEQVQPPANSISAAPMQVGAGRLVSLWAEEPDTQWGEDEYTALAGCSRLTDLRLRDTHSPKGGQCALSLLCGGPSHASWLHAQGCRSRWPSPERGHA